MVQGLQRQAKQVSVVPGVSHSSRCSAMLAAPVQALQEYGKGVQERCVCHTWFVLLARCLHAPHDWVGDYDCELGTAAVASWNCLCCQAQIQA